MNYEDRTDLAPPGDVVPLSALVRLGRDLNDASQVLERTGAEESIPPHGSIRLALEELVKRDIELGAHEGASEVARLALIRGYSYGRAVLGDASSGKPSSQLLADADRMYAYALFDYLCPSDPETFRKMLGRSVEAIVPVAHPDRYALEESASLHWFLGLAVAVVDHPDAADGGAAQPRGSGG